MSSKTVAWSLVLVGAVALNVALRVDEPADGATGGTALRTGLLLGGLALLLLGVVLIARPKNTK